MSGKYRTRAEVDKILSELLFELPGQVSPRTEIAHLVAKYLKGFPSFRQGLSHHRFSDSGQPILCN